MFPGRLPWVPSDPDGGGGSREDGFHLAQGLLLLHLDAFRPPNVGATFQRAMQTSLGSQLGRNMEAYIDDIVVKTWYKDSLIQDLHETFENLCRVNFQLNPDKCVFGVPSSKLLGFLVFHRANGGSPASQGCPASQRVRHRTWTLHIKVGGTSSVFLQVAQEIGARVVDPGSRGGPSIPQ